jgi:calcineurin-like phosphoesterase family protein
MVDIWFSSDRHWTHKGSLNWLRDDGRKVRPEFDDVEQMDEYMLHQHNACVKPQDRFYDLGDVAWDAVKFDTYIAPRLNGSKRLNPGNHDDLKDQRIIRHYKKVVLWRLFKDEGFICTHLPLRDDSMRNAYMNVHGHIHEKVIDNPRYMNVGVEQNNYKPYHMDEILQRARLAKEWCEANGVGPAFH